MNIPTPAECILLRKEEARHEAVKMLPTVIEFLEKYSNFNLHAVSITDAVRGELVALLTEKGWICTTIYRKELYLHISDKKEGLTQGQAE